ncbi:uncharacterized protein [Nothobranchius furzeri]|uniref:uncharacterized protein n=1 Tax=Nothobranchius furzeri TaxID=105023 RepID=UPI003904AF74
MEEFILQNGVLRLARTLWNEFRAVYDDPDPSEDNRQFRHAAYRQFVAWQHGKLGGGCRGLRTANRNALDPQALAFYYSSRPVSDYSASCSACFKPRHHLSRSSILPPRYSHHLPVTSSSTCTLTSYYTEPLDLLSTSHTASLGRLLSCAHLPALGTGAQLPASSTSYHSDLTRPPLRAPLPSWNPTLPEPSPSDVSPASSTSINYILFLLTLSLS